MRFNIFILVFALLCGNLFSQSNTTSGYGEFKGDGGSISQSIGQIAQEFGSSDKGSSSQGVLQVWQLEVITGAEIEQIDLYFNAYPNPVSSVLTLLVDNFSTDLQLHYQLYDISGRLLKNNQISNRISEIPTDDLVPAVYFLQVWDQEKNLKTFKISKI